MGRILIVDDEKAVRDSIACAIKRDGHDVLAAENTPEAFDLIQQQVPDLIISDICMEGGDGFAFLKCIRANPRTGAIPFIIITGHPDSEGMFKSIENAADGYLPKPFSLKTLLTAVRSRLVREEVLRRDASEIKTQLYRVLQASPDLIGMVDPESLGLFFLNSAGRRMLETDDDFQRPLTTFFPPAAADNFRNDALPAVVKSGRWSAETVLIGCGGTRVPVEIVLQAHGREDGKIEYLSIIARDLGEAKRNETALRASEFRFRCLVDSLPDGVLMYDGSGRITFCNANAARMLGYPPGELLELTTLDLFRSAPPAFSREHTAILRPGQSGGESTIYRKSGEATPVSVRLEQLEVEGERMELCIIHDLTARKQIEREREEMEVQLRQAQKLESIGQLAAGIAHEINTPTQFIGDNTRFLKEAFEGVLAMLKQYEELASHAASGAEVQRCLEEIRKTSEKLDVPYLVGEIPSAINQSLEGIERVSKIVRAMKDFSHPDSSEKSLIDVNHAIESTLTVARNEWKYVANLQTTFDPNIPPVPCLPGEFNQVILNLIVNAAHAIEDVVHASGDKGVIHVSTARVGDAVEIRISDTGTGIPESARSRIFDPFFTTKEVGKGTGQGLAIARSVIVDKHGGTIHFETKNGSGTTFIVRLPISA